MCRARQQLPSWGTGPSTTFRGSRFGPGLAQVAVVGKHWCLLALPLCINAPGAASAAFSHLLCLQVTLSKEWAVQRTEQKPDFRRWFSLNKEQGRELGTYVSSKSVFIFILLHPYQLQKGSAQILSKQDVVLFCFVLFLIFCFSLQVLPFREHGR